MLAHELGHALGGLDDLYKKRDEELPANEQWKRNRLMYSLDQTGFILDKKEILSIREKYTRYSQ